MRPRSLILLLALNAALAGCGGRERREGGPSNAGPGSASATGRTRPAGAGAEAEAEAEPAADDERPEPPAGSVTTFDVEAAAAKLGADVRARRAALGPEPVVSADRLSNQSGNTRVDMELVQALVVRALLAEQLPVKVWRGLEVPGGEATLESLQAERRSTVGLVGTISRERTKTEGETRVVMAFELALVGRRSNERLVTSTTTTVRVFDDDDDDRPSRPPSAPGEVDLSPAIAACAKAVAAARPAGVTVLAADNRTPRRLDDLAPTLAARLGAAGVKAEVLTAPQPEEDEEATRAEDYAARDYDGDGQGSRPGKPGATHALVTQLFEESWTSDDGARYSSVVAVFLLVDTRANEVTAVSVTRVRG